MHFCEAWQFKASEYRFPVAKIFMLNMKVVGRNKKDISLPHKLSCLNFTTKQFYKNNFLNCFIWTGEKRKKKKCIDFVPKGYHYFLFSLESPLDLLIFVNNSQIFQIRFKIFIKVFNFLFFPFLNLLVKLSFKICGFNSWINFKQYFQIFQVLNWNCNYSFELI